MPKIVIGLVGYYQFIRGYPLGPELKERLENSNWHDSDIEIKEMNWGPIAIVQDFQSNSIQYDRIVLVAAVDRKLQAGAITYRRWLGGKLENKVVQDRIFEAVTGVISLDNLLVIGEHFKIWPKELITIEVQLADSSFGDFVLSELQSNQKLNEAGIVGDTPLTPDAENLIDQITTATQKAVKEDIDGLPNILPLTTEKLTPLAAVCHNQFMKDCYAPSLRN